MVIQALVTQNTEVGTQLAMLGAARMVSMPHPASPPMQTYTPPRRKGERPSRTAPTTGTRSTVGAVKEARRVSAGSRTLSPLVPLAVTGFTANATDV